MFQLEDAVYLGIFRATFVKGRKKSKTGFKEFDVVCQFLPYEKELVQGTSGQLDFSKISLLPKYGVN